jgi:hypothetical protein
METLFEFMFGASGRINRVEYWLSILKFTPQDCSLQSSWPRQRELQRRFSSSRSLSS